MHFRFLEEMRPFAWAWKEIAHVMISWLARWTLEEEVQMPNVFFFFRGGKGVRTSNSNGAPLHPGVPIHAGWMICRGREYLYWITLWHSRGGSSAPETEVRSLDVIPNVFLIQTCYHTATVRATNQGWNSVIYAGELLDFSWPLWKGNFFTMSENPISPTVKFSSD